MGFPAIWHFIQEQSFERKDLDWRKVDVSKKPWIVIDWNNFVMNVASLAGGHSAIMERRVRLVFNALASSGARICVISDGSFQSAERCCIKLGRMHSRLSTYLDDDGEQIRAPSEPFQVSDSLASLAFHIAKTAFLAAFEVVSNNVEDAHDDSTMYIYACADGEADGAIRSFIRGMPGKDVFLLSKVQIHLSIV